MDRIRSVVRGGCYWFVADDARAAFRILWSPGIESVGQGFRVLLPAGLPRVDSRS